jgi:hypothetical protein
MFSPEWHALGREAELAAELLATGVTVLGRANHAQKGLYNQAFFALSIGFERLGKLILVADHTIENNGGWLTDQELRRVGHDISALINACNPISMKYISGKEFGTQPNAPIHQSIVTTLSEFARTTRYYNLASLSGGGLARTREPIEAWWSAVGQPILERHYSVKQRAKNEAQAKMMGSMLGAFATVLHHDEAGQSMTSIEAMMTRAGPTRIVQKYGRLYVMQLIRWLSTIMGELSRKGAYELQIEALLGLDEPFRIFCNEYRYLLGRKTWSIYRL